MSSARGGRPRSRRRAAPKVIGYIKQHPLATAGIAIVMGLAVRTALTSLAQRSSQAAGTVARRSPQRRLLAAPPSSRPRTHDVGAADMEFTARHPDEKNIVFRFAWKKRPVDAPETAWPTDHMAFAATHPDGTYTAFRFTRKTRPVPVLEPVSSAGDSRPGLGQATMEFIASRPGRKDFRFTWDKVPPGVSTIERKGEDHGKEEFGTTTSG